MSDPLELLISRYLDGTASPDDVRRLDERLREDPEARRALVLAAAQDTLLRECLAEARPRRWGRVVRAVAAAAAVVVAAVGLALVWPRYPMPRATGSFTVRGGGEVGRGSVLTAGAEPAAVALGGYCRVGLEPGSTVHLEGARRAEQVFLEQGGVLCEADRGVGTFAVRTAVGTASVVGTRFAVRMVEETGDKVMFDRRMSVRVLVGAVLVAGAWGRTMVHAGETAALPPPEAALGRILAGLGLPEAQRATLERKLAGPKVAELRAEFRTAVRGRIFAASHKALQSTMPKVMPKKVQPKVQAIRGKLRAGPPSRADIARIRLAVQKRTRQIMMKLMHRNADQFADEAARDDRLIAWLLAKQVRAKLPGETVAAFDAALKERGIADTEPSYIARAEAAVRAAITGYDPDISGIVDPKTGKVLVTDEDLGVPLEDEALEGRVAAKLRGVLASLDLSDDARKAAEPMLAGQAIRAERAAYHTAVRARVFDAARKTLQTTLPQKMPGKVQGKVMAIRTRVKAGGPPTDAARRRLEQAVMKRTRPLMMKTLHAAADAVAVKAFMDERLAAAAVAAKLRAKLPADQAAAFDAALAKAGVTADESAYLSEAEQRLATAIETYDPDLTGLVDPTTGEVLVTDEK